MPTEPISPSVQTEGSVGTDWTVREMVVVFVKLPDEPVTVTVTVPVAAMPLAVSVRVLVLAVLLGLNDAVTPLGRPAADKLTLPIETVLWSDRDGARAGGSLRERQTIWRGGKGEVSPEGSR